MSIAFHAYLWHRRLAGGITGETPVPHERKAAANLALRRYNPEYRMCATGGMCASVATDPALAGKLPVAPIKPCATKHYGRFEMPVASDPRVGR